MLASNKENVGLIGSNKQNHLSNDSNGVIIKDLRNCNSEGEKNKEKRISLIKQEIAKIDQEIQELNGEKETYLKELSSMANEATVAKVRNQSLFIQRVSVNTNIRQILDVISEMKKGTQLLKYGRFGSPNYHQFEVTNDNKYLRWFSRKKKNNLVSTTIELENILHLQSGHLYSQNLVDSNMHELSLSIAYKVSKTNKIKTLEVCCQNKTDFQIWTKGLELIIDTIKTVKKNNDTYDVKLHFPMDENIRFMEIHKRDRMAYEKSLSKKSDPGKDSVKSNLDLMANKYESVMDSLNVIMQNRNSESYEEFDSVLVTKDAMQKLQDEIEQVKSAFRDDSKRLIILTFDIHDIMMQLKAFDEKLFVLN